MIMNVEQPQDATETNHQEINYHSKLDKRRTAEIVARLATERATDLAKEYGVSDSRICAIKKENKNFIKTAQELIIHENVDDIVDITRQDILNVKKITTDYADSGNITSEKTSYKTSVHKNTINPIKEKVGINPSHANQFNFTQNNTKTTQIVGSVLKMFQGGAEKLLNDSESECETVQVVES